MFFLLFGRATKGTNDPATDTITIPITNVKRFHFRAIVQELVPPNLFYRGTPRASPLLLRHFHFSFSLYYSPSSRRNKRISLVSSRLDSSGQRLQTRYRIAEKVTLVNRRWTTRASGNRPKRETILERDKIDIYLGRDPDSETMPTRETDNIAFPRVRCLRNYRPDEFPFVACAPNFLFHRCREIKKREQAPEREREREREKWGMGCGI